MVHRVVVISLFPLAPVKLRMVVSVVTSTFLPATLVVRRLPIMVDLSPLPAEMLRVGSVVPFRSYQELVRRYLAATSL
jgi:hypothetical protein